MGVLAAHGIGYGDVLQPLHVVGVGAKVERWAKLAAS